MVDGSRFGIEVDCSDDAFDTDFELAPDEIGQIVDIPLGTTCTVTETSVPEPVAGYRYGEPTYLPSQTVVLDRAAIDAAGGGPVRIVVDNPIAPPGITVPVTDTTVPVTGAETRPTAYGAMVLIVLGAAALVVAGLLNRTRYRHR